MKSVSKEKQAHKHKNSQELSKHPTPQYKVSIFCLFFSKAYWEKNQENNPKELFMFMSLTAIHLLNI